MSALDDHAAFIAAWLIVKTAVPDLHETPKDNGANIDDREVSDQTQRWSGGKIEQDWFLGEWISHLISSIAGKYAP